MDRTTKITLIVFTAIVIYLMHWNIRQLSGVTDNCIMGHRTTLHRLDDFRNTILESDLLVSFVDKSDFLQIEKERREALNKVSQLTSKLKHAQVDLVSVFL